MIYLTNTPRHSCEYVGTRARGKALAAPLVIDMGALRQRSDVGILITPRAGTRLDALNAWPCAWAADTGNFTRPVGLEDYLAWLRDHAGATQRCLFATAPDVVREPVATWALSAPALPRIRALGYRAALVAQDGIESLPVEWDAFDCLFLGGSTEWKLSAAAWSLCQEAKRRGKWLHMGRVNSARRLQVAQLFGCDSADGTSLAYNPPLYIRDIQRWLDGIHRQPALGLALSTGEDD